MLSIRNSIILCLHSASLLSAFTIPSWSASKDKQFDSQKPFGSLLPSENNYKPTRLPLEEWLIQERLDAFNLLLANIGPDGKHVPGAAAGAVIASPSKQYPNYFYQWIRDAAITMGTVIGEYERTRDDQLLTTINLYIQMQKKLQHTQNPSGGYENGGLGEPKFEADGRAFWGNWGRVQNDGPALRAIASIRYLRAINMTYPALLSDATEWLQDLYDGKLPTFSTIKADLEYVAHSWHTNGFDLWEEVNGLHFFTVMTQLKAMAEGRDLAQVLGDTGASAWYEIQRQGLEELVQSFWDKDKGHLVSTLGTSRSGLDCALLLAPLHGGSDDIYPPWSDEVLISLYKLIQDMRWRHQINKEAEDQPHRAGWGIGRYPEDVYDGTGTSTGNPWFLCTSTTSEILYRTVSHYLSVGEFEITAMSLPFFQNVDPNAAVGTFAKDTLMFNATLHALYEWADGFLRVIQTHAADGGRLSEQFDRNPPGFQRGARDLTWSYGSFIEAWEQRAKTRAGLGLR